MGNNLLAVNKPKIKLKAEETSIKIKPVLKNNQNQILALLHMSKTQKRKIRC